MATEQMQHIDDAGLVLYAWPANRGIDLFRTSLFKVLLVPGTGANATKYEAEIDTSIWGVVRRWFPKA